MAAVCSVVIFLCARSGEAVGARQEEERGFDANSGGEAPAQGQPGRGRWGPQALSKKQTVGGHHMAVTRQLGHHMAVTRQLGHHIAAGARKL